MADARAIATARLLSARATARRGLLASATATVAIAVATVCALLAWLVVAVQRAGDAAPPGVPQDEVDAQVEDGVIALVSAAPALVLLVVIVAATAAAQLARLLAAAREQETANLRARGLSRGQASTANGIESAAVGVMGAIGGVAFAVGRDHEQRAAGGAQAVLVQRLQRTDGRAGKGGGAQPGNAFGIAGLRGVDDEHVAAERTGRRNGPIGDRTETHWRTLAGSGGVHQT